MKKTYEVCRDQEKRRRDIREHTDETGERDLNGIDYLEVDEKQTTLTVYFLGKTPDNVTENNVRLDGGRRIRNIRVKRIYRCDPEDPRVDGCLRVEVDRPGDFSSYTLRLVETDARGRPGHEPLRGLDPRYAQLEFSFKVGCPSELDCAPQDACPPAPLAEPEINYLAKDYASFRQLILDRLSLIMPDWKERHVPDVGIALVELLAYTGDYLSYYQDAVATEAFLDTARQRISVRRHVKLVDYQMHEGCNARAWVYVETSDDKALGQVEDVYFISSSKREFPSILNADALRDFPFSDYEVFEPIIEKSGQTLQFFQAHNHISFYTWGDRECCLPRGATNATLKDLWLGQVKPPPENCYGSDEEESAPYEQTADWPASDKVRIQDSGRSAAKATGKKSGYVEPEQPKPAPVVRARQLQLQAGDVLIFEEVRGPITGEKADADPSHRHAVRLIKVEPGIDPLYDQPVLEIEWAREDALPFALCISAIGRAPECQYLEDVSVAHGNVLLVDHGRWVGPNESWTVPEATEHDAGCLAANEPRETLLQAGPFPRPELRQSPLTFRAEFPSANAVSHRQSDFLLKLMTAVRARVEQLWRNTKDGSPLTKEEVAELRTIFGAAALLNAGLMKPHGRGYKTPGVDEQAKALQQLIEDQDRLLARKARRVRSLAARARAGYVFAEGETREIAEMFGARFAQPITAGNRQLHGPASIATWQEPREALPCVQLLEQRQSAGEQEAGSISTWVPKADLLDSNGGDRHFVVEMDNEGRARLRFGDGNLGRAPSANTKLTANYRVGNGLRGNVGAEAIGSLVFRKQSVSGLNLRVRNPLPAQGGIEAEPLAEVKLFAPSTFPRVLQRAVTSDDYARLAERGAGAKLQRAAAAPLRWTGSWYEAQVAVDPFGSEELDRDLREEVEGYLYRYRRIGHDLRVLPARFVSLQIGLDVCVLPHYLRAHVEAALLDLFSNRELANGQRGFFHPDNLSFGEGIYLSRLVAAAQAVAGVERVQVARLERLYEGDDREIENGILPLGPLEVARLDNDRSFPEHGRMRLNVGGGR